MTLSFAAFLSPAYAQSADEGAAEALFEMGKTLLEQKSYSLACPKLAESYRIDPGTGTLLALALCHEGAGRLASAWGEFAEVAARAHREGRSDREELAHQRMTTLEARLPTITISVLPGAEKIEGLEIKRDGVVIGEGARNAAVPVDPGHHHVEAGAPGYKSFATTVSVGSDADRQVVVVPLLERDDQTANPNTVTAHDGSRKAALYGGLVMGGVGIAGLAIGTLFGFRAIGFNNDSKADCDARSVCGPAGLASRDDARTTGAVSTVAFVAGGVLIAGGTTLVLIARPRAGERPSSAVVFLQARPAVSERELGLRFDGSF